jgi:hypothetical protein
MYYSFMRPFVLLTIIGCVGTDPSKPGNGTPLVGRWGGEHIALVLTDSVGSVEYDCAHGGIAGPVQPLGGRFEVTGVHVREHGGPVREGERPDTVPARYLGQVRGDRLELRVVVAGDSLGPFELRRGAEPRLFKCL